MNTVPALRFSSRDHPDRDYRDAIAAVDRLRLVTTDLDELLRQVARQDVDAFADLL